MRNFQLKGWLAVGVALAAAVALVLSVTLINRVSTSVEAFGVTHYGAVHVDDGSVSEPSHGFTDDTDTGFYRVGSNDIGVAAGGSKVGDFTSAGWTGGVSVGSNDLAGRNITATGTANVAGASALNGGLTMDTSAFSVADTSGNTQIAGTLGVTGATTLVGALAGNGGITVDSTAFVVADTSGNTNINGTLIVTGAVTANSTGSFAGDLTASAFIIHASQLFTPTDGSPITPTQSLVILAPAGEVTPTIAACVTNGTQLVLYNQEAQSINLADDGNFILTGALVLTQYDTVPLVCVATKWVQVGPVSAN